LQTGGDQGISSIIDTWVSLINIETDGERNRGMYLFKSRGMNHSNRIREYRLTDDGVKLFDVYQSASGVLTGSRREGAQSASAKHGRPTQARRKVKPTSKRGERS
jgi:circadian clock protein KaiC